MWRGNDGVKCLGTLVVPDADPPLGAEPVGPVPAEVDVGLADGPVRAQQPGAEDGLGQDVEHGVGDDLGVDRGAAGAVGDAPDALPLVSPRIPQTYVISPATEKRKGGRGG